MSKQLGTQASLKEPSKDYAAWATVVFDDGGGGDSAKMTVFTIHPRPLQGSQA